jgi:hypothetical protein
MSRHIILVWGEQCEVRVSPLSKTVFRAVGNYRSQRVQSEARTPSTALKRWKWAVQFRWGAPSLDSSVKLTSDGLTTTPQQSGFQRKYPAAGPNRLVK